MPSNGSGTGVGDGWAEALAEGATKADGEDVGLGGASDGRAAIGSGVGPGGTRRAGHEAHGADHEGRHQDHGNEEAADRHGPGGGRHGGPGSRDLGHAQTLPDHPGTNIRTMVPRTRRDARGTVRGYNRTRPTRSWRTGPDPSTRRGPASRPDVRRRDHRDRAVHRAVDDPLRDRRLGGDVGDRRHRRPARGRSSTAWRSSRVLWIQGLYRLRVRWSRRREALDVLFAVLLLAVVVFTALFLFKLPNVSRLFLVLLFPAQALLTIASRNAIRVVFLSMRASGRNTRYMLIVGANPAAETFADLMARHIELGLEPIGYLAGSGRSRERRRPARPTAGPGRPQRDRDRPPRSGRRRGRDLPVGRRSGHGRADRPPVRGRGPRRPDPDDGAGPHAARRPARGDRGDGRPLARVRPGPDARACSPSARSTSSSRWSGWCC